MTLKEYLKNYSTQKQLAEKLDISVVAVNQWLIGVRQIPQVQCVPIEKATKGIVTRFDLRPDIDWSYLLKTPEQHFPPEERKSA